MKMKNFLPRLDLRDFLSFCCYISSYELDGGARLGLAPAVEPWRSTLHTLS